jgi:hypothetical protein
MQQNRQDSWFGRLWNRLFSLFGVNSPSETPVPLQSSLTEPAAHRDLPPLKLKDFGADVCSEFLENPGELFWMFDGLYRGIAATSEYISSYFSKPTRSVDKSPKMS